jgi:hypothetical protein
MEDLNYKLIKTIRNNDRHILSKCKELLIAGADPNYNYINEFAFLVWRTKSPLYLASEYQNYRLCKLLLDYGADVNSFNTDTYCSPLYNACKEANYKLCKLFIDRGADVNCLTKDGDTVLEAVMYSYINKFNKRDNNIQKVCELFINNGFNLVIDGIKITEKKDRFGFKMISHIRDHTKKIYEYIVNEVEKYIAYSRRKNLIYYFL